MNRKNFIALALILVVFFAINSYGQTLQREDLLAVNQNLAEYNVKQASAASAAFSLRDYYKETGLAIAEAGYGEIGVLIDNTIQRSSIIQLEIANNLDNYENIRIDVKSKLAELRNVHTLAQKQLNETIEEIKRVRPAVKPPSLISQQDANVLKDSSFNTVAVLYYSDARTAIERNITPNEIKSGLLKGIIASMPSGGTTIIDFLQTTREQAIAVEPGCRLRLVYTQDAVTGLKTTNAGNLIALGGTFKTTLPSCMFKIGGTFFYNVKPVRYNEDALYCALPPAISGSAEAWAIGKGCQESEHISFNVLP